MLGHKMWQVLDSRFETRATVRASIPRPLELGSHAPITGVRAEDVASVTRALRACHPDVVVNCIGIVKQRAASRSHIASITINSLFPHQLSAITADLGARLIHVSTDCVFSGAKGNYSETDDPDPKDLYGRTKLLGEVDHANCLTLRTSIIGRELTGAHGLLEWFLQQTGPVAGYTNAVFSGMTTRALAETVADIVAEHPSLTGFWHVASEPITKYDLLHEFARVFRRDVEIRPDDTVRIDRSLDDSSFRTATAIPKPRWPSMLHQLASDPTPYDELRRVTC